MKLYNETILRIYLYGGEMEQGNSTSIHKGWYGRGYHPHCDCPGLIQSVGFRLFDSVPAKVVERWLEELHHLPDSQKRTELNNRIDRYADQGYGSSFLADVRIAELTENALLHFDNDRYDLLAWCVMPNHVHALIATRIGYSLAEILHSRKSYTAHRANKILDRNGDFWLVDYFDQFMRTTDQMETTIMYIEFNPVKAGLVESPSIWRFSSSYPKHQERVKSNRIKYPAIDPSSLPDIRC